MFCERRSPVSSLEADAEAVADELLDPLDRDRRRLALRKDVAQDVLRRAATSIVRPVSDEKATTRVSAPSSSRMFVETRLAMNVSTSVSSTSIPSYFTLRRRIAMRVSRSGGWMSVISPHSKRERSRSSSVCDVARRPVGAHDDLAAGLVERVEGVEELLLDPLLVLEELDVVDQQHVVGAVALLEALDPLVAQRVDEVVHERLRGDVAHGHVRRVRADVVRDRVQQVRLPEAGVPVDEERVVGLGRRLGDRERGCVREAVRRADHERVEGVLRVDAARLDARRRRRRATGLEPERPRRRRTEPAAGHDGQLQPPLRPGRVLDRRADQLDEVALDPLAREVVRDARARTCRRRPTTAVDLAEPVAERLLVECAAQARCDVVPEALSRQLDRVAPRL